MPKAPKEKAPEAPAEEAKAEAAAEPKEEKKAAVPVTLEVLKGFSLRSLDGGYAVWSEATNARLSPLVPDENEARALLRGLAR